MTFDFYTFLSNYTLQTLIVATIVAILSLVLDKFIAPKLKTDISNSFPFALGVLLTFLYEIIFDNAEFKLTQEIVCEGILCGSISTVFYALIKNLFNGKNSNVSTEILSIETFISSIVDKENLEKVAKKIDSVFTSTNSNTDYQAEIIKILNEFKLDNITEEKIVNIAKNIILSISNLKKANGK